MILKIETFRILRNLEVLYEISTKLKGEAKKDCNPLYNIQQTTVQRDTDYRNRTIYLLCATNLRSQNPNIHAPLASAFRHQQIGFEVIFNQTPNPD